MKQKQAVHGVLVAALAASVGWVVWVGRDVGSAAARSGTHDASTTRGAANARPDAVSASPAPEDERRFLDDLRHRFGANIRNPYWQIQLLDFLQNHFRARNPNDWQAKVRETLKKLFPDMAETLLARFGAYQDYLSWVAQNGDRTFNSMAERRRATWDKRRALFGEDAAVIWADELKQEKIAGALQALATSTQPFKGKVDTLTRTLREAYGESYRLVDNTVETTELMSTFLKLPSVQDDLSRLGPDQQRESLRELRSAMGLDREALDRWDKLDAERAARRAAGDTYMAARSQLEQKYSGEALQLQVQGLQNRLFGAEEAQYIRNEEASGYYRYKEKQVIGVN